MGNLDFLELREGKPSAADWLDVTTLLIVLSANLAADVIRDVVRRAKRRRRVQ